MNRRAGSSLPAHKHSVRSQPCNLEVGTAQNPILLGTLLQNPSLHYDEKSSSVSHPSLWYLVGTQRDR